MTLCKICKNDCSNLKLYNRKSAAWVEEKKKRRKRKKHNLNPHFDENSVYRRGRGGSGTKVRIFEILDRLILRNQSVNILKTLRTYMQLILGRSSEIRKALKSFHYRNRVFICGTSCKTKDN